MEKFLTVSQLSRIIKQDLESNPYLHNVQVMGEVSNFKFHSASGHFYFTLKDDGARLSCVMFKSYAQLVKFKLYDGLKIIVKGSISVYPSTGAYQLYVSSMEPVGVGDLYLQFEELKKKLYQEGLFEESHKKKIPEFPSRIGVISANEAAALQDVITTVKRRWPIAELTLIPSLVQGKMATDSVCNALLYADKCNFDVIIVARGGGSIEDLWCFNEEKVARVVYNLNTPIISAVGHETDTTIIDYVSDLRAPTPTGAAERATPSIIDVQARLESIKDSLTKDFRNLLDNYKNKVELLKSNRYLSSIEPLFADKQVNLHLLENRLQNASKDMIFKANNKIKELSNKLVTSYNNIFIEDKHKLEMLISKLDALSPLKIMGRGYGIVTKEDKVITKVIDLKENDIIKVEFNDGNVEANIVKVNKKGE